MAVAEIDPYDGGLGDVRAGSLEARLARGPAEVAAAQALRYRVFYEEQKAVPTPAMARRRLDFDAFDDVCDHLLVVDHAVGAVVGTYRLLRRSVAQRHGGFYSASEYDIANILSAKGEILELGRSCVDRPYRTRATLQLLWRAIGAYAHRYDITHLFGCASFPGTDPEALTLPLSYLYHNHLAPAALRPRALPHLRVEMNRMPRAEIDLKRALHALPPLLKGYLRFNGFVGDGAVVDRQFNTTDVCLIVQLARVSDRYRERYDNTGRGAD